MLRDALGILGPWPQETLNFAIHVVDHPPLASSVARTAGQGQSLTEYVARPCRVGKWEGEWAIKHGIYR